MTDTPDRTATYSVSLQDFRAGNMLWHRVQLGWPQLLRRFVIYVVIFWLVLFITSLDHTLFVALFDLCVSVFAGILMIILLPLFYRITVPWRAKRLYARLAHLVNDVTLTWSDEELNETTKDSQQRLDWDKFSTWTEDSKIMLLGLYANLFVVIPKSALTETQREDIITCLKAHKIKPAKPFWL